MCRPYGRVPNVWLLRLRLVAGRGGGRAGHRGKRHCGGGKVFSFFLTTDRDDDDASVLLSPFGPSSSEESLGCRDQKQIWVLCGV